MSSSGNLQVPMPAVSAVEVRSNVAATAASVIPFHCIICFDEFDTTDRPPMILPCGHTYICKPCSKRLKRCMECREPLFWTVTVPLQHTTEQPPPSPLPAIMSTGSNGHMSSPQRARGKQIVRPQVSPPQLPLQYQQQQQLIPLPIPKNLVLLAMMEAAELQKTRSTNLSDGAEFDENADREEMRKQQEDSEHDEEIRVVAGMATMAGPCGTYAVRERQGLVVLAQDPRLSRVGVLKESSASNVSSSSISASDSFHQLTASKSTDNDILDDILKEEKPVSSPRNIENHVSFQGKTKDCKEFRIGYGQKLQVVSFEDQVATLARNQGFVVANHSQLVKVGGPLDESCFLEGLLDTVSAQGRDLKLHLKENDKLEATLQEQVRNVQSKSPTHPVISEAPPAVLDLAPETPARNGNQFMSSQHPKTPDYNSILQPSLQSPPDTMPALRPSLSGDRKDSSFLRGVCPPMPESPASIDNADLSTSRRRTAVVNSDQSSLILGCGTFPDFLTRHEEPPASPTTSPLVVRGLAAQYRSDPEKRQRSASTSTLSPNNIPTTPHRQQQQHSLATSSFDSVDFRTGLSGHYGLATASRRNFKHSPNTQQQQRSRRMMGVHSGIGGLGARQRASAASYNHWGAFHLS